MLGSYYSGRYVPVKNILVISSIQMQDFLNQNSSFEDQSVNFERAIVDKHSYSVSFVRWITEGNGNNIFSLLVCHLKLDIGLIIHRSNWILPKNNAVSAGCVMQVVGDDSWAIIVQQYAFAMFFIRAHSSHVDCIVIVAEVLVVLCCPADGYFAFFVLLSGLYFFYSSGFGGGEALLHFIEIKVI